MIEQAIAALLDSFGSKRAIDVDRMVWHPAFHLYPPVFDVGFGVLEHLILVFVLLTLHSMIFVVLASEFTFLLFFS